MVKLVPSFLRKIVTQKDTISEPNAPRSCESNETYQSSSARGSAPVSPSVKSIDRRSCSEPSTPFAKDYATLNSDFFEGGITSNIATVALSEWGFPAVDDVKGEINISGNYFKGLLRNYVSSSDPLKGFIASSRTNLIPKVEESDFTEYIRQISVFYITMEKDNAYGRSSDASINKEDETTQQIPMQYYSENYDLASNGVFREELEHIPAIMNALEGQLLTVNGELQELLERRYDHVHEACSSVEELYKRFMDVTNDINQIRVDLDGGTTSSDMTTKDDDKTTIPVNKQELDWVFESGIDRKRSLQSMLNRLQVLRAVAAMPEYIQGIADSNGLAMANIVRDYMLQYIKTELWQFKLAQSVASVLGETVSNVERVAETKFINLALVALVEVSGLTSINDGVESLKIMLNQMHQPLIALCNADSMQTTLETLAATSKETKAAFTYMEYDTWDDIMEAIEKRGAEFILFFFLSHVWGCMLLRRIFCVERSKARSEYLLTTEKSTLLIKKILLVVQENLSSVTPRGKMATVSHISTLISSTLALPSLCDEDMDYTMVFDAGVVNEAVIEQSDDSEATKDEDLKDFIGYVASVKGIIDTVALNTFEDFAKHLVVLCNVPVDFKVPEFVAFIESFRAFKLRYEQLLADIEAKDLFYSIVSAMVSLELKAHVNTNKPENSSLVDVLNSISNIEEDVNCKLKERANQAIRVIGLSCLELLKLGNIMNVQKTLAGENWDVFDVHKSAVYEEDNVSFALVTSSPIIHEKLNLYSLVTDICPDTGEDAVQDCVQVIALYYSLLDAEGSVLQSHETELDEAAMRKACLMVESLRYFSRMIVDIVGGIIDLMKSPYENCEMSPEPSSDADQSKHKGYYAAAEKCSDDLESLKQRIMHIMSTDIGNKMKQHMLAWILQPADTPYDDTGLHGMIDVVQRSVDTISMVLKNLTDIQMIFDIAFQQVCASIPREEINVKLMEDFRDSCVELITHLSHNTCIKLEVCWLTDTLSNELFS